MTYTDREIAGWKASINAGLFLESRLKLQRQDERQWIGGCPFHKDEVSTFLVYWNESTQQWDCHCHGTCSRSWNLFQVVMKTDKLGFSDAVAKVLSEVNPPDDLEQIIENCADMVIRVSLVDRT